MAAALAAFCEGYAREITAPRAARCHAEIQWQALGLPALKALRVGGSSCCETKPRRPARQP